MSNIINIFDFDNRYKNSPDETDKDIKNILILKNGALVSQENESIVYINKVHLSKVIHRKLIKMLKTSSS